MNQRRRKLRALTSDGNYLRVLAHHLNRLYGARVQFLPVDRVDEVEGYAPRKAGVGGEPLLVMGSEAVKAMIGGPSKSHGVSVDAVRTHRGAVVADRGLNMVATFAPRQSPVGETLDLISADVGLALGGERPRVLGGAEPSDPPPRFDEVDVSGCRVLAIDTEYDPDTWELKCAAVSGSGGVYAAEAFDGRAAGRLAGLIAKHEASGGWTAGWSSLSADVPKLAAAGVSFDPERHVDAMLLWRAAAPQSRLNGLRDVAACFIEARSWKTDASMYSAGAAALLAGCVKDAEATRLAYIGLRKLVADRGAGRVYQELRVSAQAAGEMEWSGLRVSEIALCQVKMRAEAARDAVDGLPVHVNPNAPKQVMQWAEDNGLRLPNTAKGTLLATGEPQLAAVVEWKKHDRTRGFAVSVVGKLRGGRVHPHFKPGGAVSGRLSCVEPNLQQMPPAMRKAFVPDPGCALISADYSGIEMRVAAILSGDGTLYRMLRDGVDIQRWAAARAFDCTEEEVEPEQRQAAKMCNFAILYGSGEDGVAARVGETARAYHRAFPKVFPGVSGWMKRVVAEADRTKQLTTVFGRTRKWLRVKPTEVQNYPIQSTAASVFHGGLWRAHRAMPKGSLRLAIHDEIVACVPSGEAEHWKGVLSEAMQYEVGELGGEVFPVESGGPATDWSGLK